MKKHAIGSALIGAMATMTLLCSTSARAQSLVSNNRFTADVDAVFLKLHTSIGTGDSDLFGFETGQRVALSYLHDSNVGFRTTWFEWDHAADDSVVDEVALDTYNLDFEAFKRIDFSSRTILEASAGLRYNDTTHDYDGDPNDFTGIGGVFGLRGGLRVFDNGLIFTRAKFAVLMGDGAHDGDDEDLDPANDVVRSQTELGLGYEHRLQFGGLVVVPRFGVEWQIWDGFGLDPVDEHPDTDLGLFGFSGGIGIAF